MSLQDHALESLISIGAKFWNIRSSFKFLMGFVEVGTHLSIAQLENGKFLIIDTIDLTPTVLAKINHLTDNGNLIEAVVATHPYHTIFFPAFYRQYPQAAFYGTPRHLRIQPEVKWAGDITEEQNLRRWEGDGVFLRVPAGVNFAFPLKDNHFAGIFVFHAASRTLHVDDTVGYVQDPSWLLRKAGVKPGRASLHPQYGTALTGAGALQFQSWFEQLLDDWDFDNFVVAHNGFKLGGGRQELRNLLEAKRPLFAEIAARP